MPDSVVSSRRVNKNDVFLQLRSRIVKGTYQTGQRLPSERELASSFGIARGTLRESLRELERNGLVERRQGSGTYVCYSPELSPQGVIEKINPAELVDSRLALEPQICSLAARNVTHRDLERLEDILVGMEHSETDLVQFSRRDDEFHMALAEIAGNRMMLWMAQNLSRARGHAQWSRVRALSLNTALVRIYNRQHRKIVEAIATHDSESAALLMQKHIKTARETLVKLNGNTVR